MCRWVSSLLMCALFGCATSSDPIPPAPAVLEAQLEESRLGAGDIVEIRVYREPDLNGVYRVSPQGEIDFPLIRKVRLLGLDANAVAEEIRNRLADGYLVDPQVTVFVRERNSQKVHVLGQVKKPGSFSFAAGMTVIEAITNAGGFGQHASTNSVSVTRVVDGKEQRFVLPVRDIGAGQAPNFVLQPGDIVYVPEALL